jgi:dihydroflavonol-4-reductase
VHVSSVHAFKTLPHGTVVDESTPLALDAPTGSYNRTKAEGTLRMLETVEQGLDAVIVCPTGIIGPYDYLQSEMGATLQDFTQRKVHVLVKGAYDFVDVRDVVAGLQHAGDHGKTGELYILSGHKVTLTHLRRSVQNLVGTQTPVLFMPFGLARAAARMLEYVYKWTGQTPRFTTYSLDTVQENALFSHNKATRTFNYRPRPLDETLRDTLAWRQRLG